MKKLVMAAVAGLSMISGYSAYAQGGNAGCGNEPKVPSINVSNVANYNASVEAYTRYNNAVRTYYACVAKQARARQVAISQKAKEDMDVVQKSSAEIRAHLTTNLNRIQAELKAGGQKLGAVPSKGKR